MIPYSRQKVDKKDIKAVVNVLKSDFLTQGPKVDEFEKSIIKFTNAKFAISANSATSALHLVCLAIGVKKGDIVWTSPISFVASSNCALYCGAKIDFVDIDPVTYNMCPLKLEEKLKKIKNKKKLPKAIIVVHMAGLSCDMKKIYGLSKKYNFKLIEDASHALGSKYFGDYVGSCRYSDAVVFSFHPVKIITTGEGGMITTNNKRIAKNCKLLRTHGINKNKKDFINKKSSPWHYEQIQLGLNYRMNDLSAALGISQLKKVKQFVAKRNSIALKYNKLFSELLIQLPFLNKNYYCSYHLYIINLKTEKLTKSHEEIFIQLKKHGLGVNVHYMPIHLHPYYRKLGFKKNMFVNAENYSKKAISIPLYPSLSDRDLKKVVSIIKKIIS
jgi:UDP-4-amino-4,6-dideoxy-N-acetyl-beta-L-altrosamine transaminase